MHHSRVEIGSLVKCGRDHGGRQGRGGLEKEDMLAFRESS